MSINILINKLPKSVYINDAEIGINTDFRFCLNIILAFEDKELSDDEKIYILLKNIYGHIPEDNIQEHINEAIKFLNCGEEFNQDAQDKPRLYSFEKDSKYIYVAMKQSLNVDFEKDIHWWDFVNYFLALDEKSFFSRILYLRSQKRKGKLTKEELKYWNENKDILELDEEVNEEDNEVIDNFRKLLKGDY